MVLPVALTPSCGFDDTLILQTTRQPGDEGKSGSASVGGGTAGQTPAPRVSPFCAFKWGRSWAGTNAEVQALGKPAYPYNLGMMSIWFGYETDNVLNPAITKMLATLGPSGDAALSGVVPVFYAYLIPFKADLEGISKDCNPTATTPNICIDGAQWIRNNRDKLRSIYGSYADQVATAWGTARPVIWLFEPSFNDYTRTSQTAPLSLAELAAVATDLIATIKLRLPNAWISHFASPDIPDLQAYFAAMDMKYVDLVNVTGTAKLAYFGAGNNAANPSATYSRLHAASGRHIFVDTGFGASAVGAVDWLSSGPDTVNQRIADGVIAVQIDQAPASMQSDIAALAPKLSGLACSQ